MSELAKEICELKKEMKNDVKELRFENNIKRIAKKREKEKKLKMVKMKKEEIMMILINNLKN